MLIAFPTWRRLVQWSRNQQFRLGKLGPSSSLDDVIAASEFPTSADADSGDPTDGTLTGNTARIEGPTMGVVPEPGTLLLISAGLVGAGGYMRRRLRRQQ